MTRLDVTKEARREMNRAFPHQTMTIASLEAFARRLLRRAAGEVEKLRAVEGWKFEHGEVERERFNEGVEWSRDHLRALACPPRRTRK